MDESIDGAAFLVIAALIVIVIAMFYFRTEQFVEEEKTFDEVLDEHDPGARQELKEIRLRKQKLENELGEIDNRLREIKETALNGHSSAYYTTELNELSTKRAPIANKLEMVKAEERKLGYSAADFVKEILDEEYDQKYVNL